MKIGICEDSLTDRKILKDVLISILSEYERLECFNHGAAFLESHNKKPFDIVFLDIGLPNLNGISVAKEIRDSSEITHIIFISQYKDYAAESYVVKAFDYLNKPIDREEVLNVFRRARHSRLTSGKPFAITTNYETVYVLISNIIYAETLRNKVRIYTYDDTFETRMTMQTLTDQLSQYGFFRIHSSYIVNLKCVRTVSNKIVMLDNGIEIPVGKTKRINEIKASIRLFREM